MKTTNNFKKVIKSYLDKRAEEDALFAEKYNNKKKNIDDCITYILNTVKATGCNGFADDEIYGMAVHYYDEESIDVGEKIKARVIINQTVELTEEEKQEARQKAIKEYQDEYRKKELERKTKKRTKQREDSEEVEQLSLF